MDVHTWQKWGILWPQLRSLPRQRLRVLDAGCGRGGWIKRLARHRPNWDFTGVDLDGNALAQARKDCEKSHLTTVWFIQANLLELEMPQSYDVILSVASAHYAVDAGRGEELFCKFHDWLAPGGVLLLLGPRRRQEMPHCAWLPRLGGREVFSAEQLLLLCRQSGMTVEKLEGRVGWGGALVKQFAVWSSASMGSRWMKFVTIPVCFAINWLGRFVDAGCATRSIFFLLVARRSVEGPVA